MSVFMLLDLFYDSISPALQSSVIHGCILVGTTGLFTALWIAPLVTDTCILFLTLWQARHYIEERSIMP
jgi:hypothetical protein